MAQRRPRLCVAAPTLFAVLSAGCGEIPDPPFVLREEPELLAFRVEVTDRGPHGAFLLPIPADRVRSEPLPLDRIEVTPFVASDAGPVDPADLDPTWLLCPAGACISTLRDPGAGEPCDGRFPDRVACVLPSGGPTTSFVVPDLDPALPLVDQARFRVALVGHTDPDLTTDACVDRVADPKRPPWDGCIVGYVNVGSGPQTLLYALAEASGIELPDVEVDPESLAVPVAPHFNPEVVPLRLIPILGEGRLDETRQVEAFPGTVTALPTGSVFSIVDDHDVRDEQPAFIVRPDGVAMVEAVPAFLPHTDLTDSLLFGRTGWEIETPSEPTDFSLYVVLSDPLGGVAWSVFDFEVTAQ